jgi:hypothetical protein
MIPLEVREVVTIVDEEAPYDSENTLFACA